MCEAWRSAPDAERSRPNAMRQITVPASDDRRLPRVPRWLRVGLSLVILGLTVWFLVVPQFAEARRALYTLERISLPLVLLAAALELTTLVAFSALTASVLGPGRPSYFTLLRIDITDLGVNHVVPGGGATAAAVRFRLLQRAGVRRARAFMTATIETMGSNLVLGAIFVVGIALSLAAVPTSGFYLLAILVVLALLVGVIAGAWLLTRRTDRAVGWARAIARRLPFVTPDQAEGFVRKIAEQVVELVTDPRRMAIALTLAAANWLLDAAALGVLLAALGHTLGIGALLTVYGLGGILALLPLTPGGLGIVEGVLVPALVAFGTPPSTALVAVIGWRLLEYWLPIPLALLSYLSLRLGVLRRPVPSRTRP